MGEAVAVLVCGNAVCEYTLPCGCGGVSSTDGCISWTRRQWWEVGAAVNSYQTMRNCGDGDDNGNQAVLYNSSIIVRLFHL